MLEAEEVADNTKFCNPQLDMPKSSHTHHDHLEHASDSPSEQNAGDDEDPDEESQPSKNMQVQSGCRIVMDLDLILYLIFFIV